MYAVTVLDETGQVVHTADCSDMTAAKHSANTTVGLPYCLVAVNQHDERMLDMQVKNNLGVFHVLIQGIGGLHDDFSDIVAGWEQP